MSRRFAWLLLLLCGLAQADDSAEKERLKKERAAVEAEHKQREQACHQQFAVNACLEKARVDRQKALQTVRTQELAIEDAERRDRAQAQAERLNKKAQAAQERNSNKAVEPRQAKPPRSAPAKAAKPPSSKASASDRSAHEKEQREAFEARQREIKAHREEVEKRNAERVKRKTPHPLPVPASAAMP